MIAPGPQPPLSGSAGSDLQESHAPSLLTAVEVQARARRIYELISQEEVLQESLVRLALRGDRTQVAKGLLEHDATLEEIRRIRHDEILPLVTELQDYLRAVERPET